MGTLSWKIETQEDGVSISCASTNLLGRSKSVPISDWDGISSKFPGIDLLRFLVDAKDAVYIGDAVFAPHDTVSSLEENQAALVGLPPAIPHALQLRSHGTIDEPEFSISFRWLRHGNTPIAVSTVGAIASEGERNYRIPESLYRVIKVVKAYTAADTKTRAARVEHWQPIQDAMAWTTDGSVRPDGYLTDMRIFHAASLSLSAELSRDKGITFEPVLFGRAVLKKHQEDLFGSDPLADPAYDCDTEFDDSSVVNGIDTLVDEADALLPYDLNEIFIRQRLKLDENCREAYPLVRNTYVYIDAPLRKALDVVKAMQSASAAERRSFAKNPRQTFADALGEGGNMDAIHGLFVETQQYAEWVNGVGFWRPKILPWLPRSPGSWLPEKLGFTIDGKNIEVLPNQLEGLRTACETAIVEAKVTFDFEDLKSIPATSETLATIDTLCEMAAHMVTVHKTKKQENEIPKNKYVGSESTYVVDTEDNLEEMCLKLGLRPRDTNISEALPKDLIGPENLFLHQIEGFNWLVKSWKIGRPGVLLADDMGLGKTIQTLAFAAWLQTNYQALVPKKRGPILIVAPTALLKNWREEHDKHLAGGGIGPITELYGGGIRTFKVDARARRDTLEGYGVLDRDKLLRTSCILTTYETLANYQISFAGLRYPLVVFDEIQKLKTPTTINTHAAKTLNIDFVVGLTGTPVENNLSELWSIMDRLHPGLLEDLRSFSQKYRAEDTGSLRLLQDELNDSRIGSAVMLRRMKDTVDLGKVLPQRQFVSLVREMPEDQARAYENTVAMAQMEMADGATRGIMLKALQRMRGISLHPEHPSTVLGQPEAYKKYIAQSARLNAAIETLDSVQSRGEKALVFIEYREMQRVFADILRHRYQLPVLPSIINGQTPSARRQELVTRFQRSPIGEFDVMILAPRAAGVGLNITIANHVIHLSRWWNPAVEDQCNDRAYRIGQDKKVTVYLPIARHSVFGDSSFDVKLDELLSRKRKLSQDLLVPVESESDYEEMFSSTVSL